MNSQEIDATTSRRADGWAAVLAFTNGGRQLFSSRHGTHDSALLEAQHAKRARLEYPARAAIAKAKGGTP